MRRITIPNIQQIVLGNEEYKKKQKQQQQQQQMVRNRKGL